MGLHVHLENLLHKLKITQEDLKFPWELGDELLFIESWGIYKLTTPEEVEYSVRKAIVTNNTKLNFEVKSDMVAPALFAAGYKHAHTYEVLDEAWSTHDGVVNLIKTPGHIKVLLNEKVQGICTNFNQLFVYTAQTLKKWLHENYDIDLHHYSITEKDGLLTVTPVPELKAYV